MIKALSGWLTNWQGLAIGASLIAAASFSAGWTVNGWRLSTASLAQDLSDEAANSNALSKRVARLQREADLAAQRDIEATELIDALQNENRALRTNLEVMTANVEISDACAQCRLGADAVSVLRNAATGSVAPIPD